MISSPVGGYLDWLPSAAVYAVQLPKADWLLFAGLLVPGVLRLLWEWQVRLTLVAVLDHSPGGTVVVVQRRRFSGGPSMWVQVGHGYRPGSPPQLNRGRD